MDILSLVSFSFVSLLNFNYVKVVSWVDRGNLETSCLPGFHKF